MGQETVLVKTKQQASAYEIRIGEGLLKTLGTWAVECVDAKPSKVVIVSNRRVFSLYGDVIRKSLSASGLDVSVHLIGDGERFKNLATLERILGFLGKERITRTDVLIALGGGVVGDITGFAASIHLRGVPFLQVPTTLLSMIDSSVGGKTGVNSEFGKNLIGSFYQPKGVLIDPDVLRTLPKREITAGYCEAIKQGALAGRPLLELTADTLGGSVEISRFLAAQVGFKATVVLADERESANRKDKLSRKILNFGHTFAHALEKVTNYRLLKHGEAVGYGILFASELSKKLEFIGQNEVDSLSDVVRRAGHLPPIRSVDPSKVIESFKYDKKVVQDSLQWVLLKGIGKPVIVPNTHIPHSDIVELVRDFTTRRSIPSS
ncbi:MAG TPA: 3-dehydroquinate synthase [Pyrinomonadaceae bacterium]|nr:3-dehydroquinate synthase [Pyrinomonadaceae bacterium]